MLISSDQLTFIGSWRILRLHLYALCFLVSILPFDPLEAKSKECEFAETNKHNVCSQVLIETGDIASQFVKKIKADPYNRRDIALEGRKQLQRMADKFAPECAKHIKDCTKKCKPEDKAYCESRAQYKHIYLEFAARFVLFEGGESETKEEDKKALAPSADLADFMGQMNWVVQNLAVGSVDTREVRTSVGLDAGAPPPRVYGPAEPPRPIPRSPPNDSATGEIKASDLSQVAQLALQAQKQVPAQAQPPAIPSLVLGDDPRLSGLPGPIPTEVNRGTGQGGVDPALKENLGSNGGASPILNSNEGSSKPDESKKYSSALNGFETGGGAGLKPANPDSLTGEKKDKPTGNSNTSPAQDPGGGYLNVESSAVASAARARSANERLKQGTDPEAGTPKPTEDSPNWNSMLLSASQFREKHLRTRSTASSLEHGIAGPHENIWMNASRAYINWGHKQSFLHSN